MKINHQIYYTIFCGDNQGCVCENRFFDKYGGSGAGPIRRGIRGVYGTIAARMLPLVVCMLKSGRGCPVWALGLSLGRLILPVRVLALRS